MLSKVLKFFFGFSNKCDVLDRRYRNRGYFSRIMMIFTYIIFSTAILSFLYFVLPLAFEKNVIVGILAVLLEIGLFFTVVSEEAIMAVVAFKCFLVRNIIALKDNIKNKKEKKRLEQLKEENNSEVVAEEPKTSNEINEEIANQEEKKKSYRLFDFFAIFIFAGIAVATVAVAIVIAKSLSA